MITSDSNGSQRFGLNPIISSVRLIIALATRDCKLQ